MSRVMEYCEVCGKEVKTEVVTRTETFTVYGEDISVDAEVKVCAECGEELFSEELDSGTLVRVYNEYRRRHKLLLPEEIKAIREQYGLSQRSFARLLNWGDKTIFRYENGSIQDKAHNSLLLFLRRPENMRTYLSENEVPLEEKQKQKLLETVDRLERNTESRKERRLLDFFFSGLPSEENGFREFDYDKVCAMVLFFSLKGPGLLKTKLMKLLNYSDMVFFRENGISISGLRYVHLPYGPVPENFELLLGMMSADHVIQIEITSDNGYERHQVIPESTMPEGALSPEELDVLERIYMYFRDFGSSEISAYSHREKGYLSTSQGEIIPYSYAKYIRLGQC